MPFQFHMLKDTIMQAAGVQAALLSALDAMLTSDGQLPSPLPLAAIEDEADGLPSSFPLSAQQGPGVASATGTHSSVQGECGFCPGKLESNLLCLTTLVKGLLGLLVACTCVLHSSREVWVHLQLVCTALPDHAVFAFPVVGFQLPMVHSFLSQHGVCVN